MGVQLSKVVAEGVAEGQLAEGVAAKQPRPTTRAGRSTDPRPSSAGSQPAQGPDTSQPGSQMSVRTLRKGGGRQQITWIELRIVPLVRQDVAHSAEAHRQIGRALDAQRFGLPGQLFGGR